MCLQGSYGRTALLNSRFRTDAFYLPDPRCSAVTASQHPVGASEYLGAASELFELEILRLALLALALGVQAPSR